MNLKEAHKSGRIFFPNHLRVVGKHAVDLRKGELKWHGHDPESLCRDVCRDIGPNHANGIAL